MHINLKTMFYVYIVVFIKSTDGVQTVTDSLTGSENRPVLFNFVDCQGSETKLIECSFTHYSYCPNPAAVSCNN